MTLDEVLPAPDWAERHSRAIAAPPAVVLAAARAVTIPEMRLAAVLLTVRGFGRPPPMPFTTLLEQRIGGTWLESGPGGDVWGGVLRPWRNQSHPIADRDALLAFDEPGWVKVAMDLTVEPHGGGTLLSDRDADRRHERRRAAHLRPLLACRAAGQRPRPAIALACSRAARAEVGYGRIAMTQLRVQVDGYPDSDDEERADLASRLREEMRRAGRRGRRAP